MLRRSAVVGIVAAGLIVATVLGAAAAAAPSATLATKATAGHGFILRASDARVNLQFGRRAAVSGHTVVVDAVQGTAGGAAYVFVRPKSGWKNLKEIATITPPDSGGIDPEANNSVAVSGDTIVLSEPGVTIGSNTDQGVLYVYEEPKHGWASTSTPTATLSVSDGAENDALGGAAIDGNTIVAGSPNHEVDTTVQQGAAYVFVRPKSGWATTATPTAELTSSDGSTQDGFGSSVAVHGDTVAVAAPNESVFAHDNAGAGYLFVRPHTGWHDSTETARAIVGQGTISQDLGSGGAAIDGTTLVLGAPNDSVLGEPTGSAYVFTKPAGGWKSEPDDHPIELTAADGQAGDAFGTSVHVSARRIAVGSFNHTAHGVTDAGAGYVFTEPAKGWRNTSTAAKFAESAPTLDDHFIPLGIDGPVIVAGADSHGVGGAAYVFAPPRPRLTKVKESHHSWVLGPHKALVNKPHHPKGGTVFTLHLSQAATVTLTFASHAHGKPAGSLILHAHQGINTVWFDGLLRHHKKLAAGHHTLTVTATNANGTVIPTRLHFTAKHA